MRTSVDDSRMKDPAWEGQEEFLEFLSGVQGEVEHIGKELGADFRLEVAPPESIDGDRNAPRNLSFFICLRKNDFPALSWCLYTRLDIRSLKAFAGQYDAGRVTTIKELRSLYDPKGSAGALKGWLREIILLSLDKKTENA